MNRTRDSRPQETPKTVIGWREYVSLPDVGIDRIAAKADTGARTGAIDVANLKELAGGRVRFDLVIDRADPAGHITVTTDIARRTRVRSSFGAAHERLLIRTRLKLGPVTKMVELGLVCRKNMLCRMLLGRAALEPEFLVDSSRRYLFGAAARRKSAKGRPSARQGLGKRGTS
jgi:hypothetical protein